MADPFSSWGPEESGIRIAERDATARGKAALDAYETLGNIAMQPVKGELLTQQAARARAQAEQEALENDAMRRMQAELQKTPLSDDPIDALYDVMKAAGRAGDMKTATAAAQRANQGIQQRAMAQRAMSQAEAAQVGTKIKQNDTFANMLGGVTNQATLDAANQVYERMFGEASPLRGKAYDPREVQEWQDSTLSKKDRLNAKLREIEEKGRQWGRSITDRHNRATEELRAAEIEQRERLKTTNEKAGGKGAGQPSRDVVAFAAKLLKEQQPDLKDAAALELASESIASRAMEITRTNRAIGREQAIQQAYAEELKEGSFKTESKTLFDVEVPFSKTTKLMGRSRDSAIPLPAGDGVPRAGRWYNTSRGVARWNGKVFTTEEEDE